VNVKTISAVCAAAALSATPLLAGATGTVASPNGQITTNVSATVQKDCKINEAGPLSLAFGTINLIRGNNAATPTASFSITCNNGTSWHLAADATGSAPVDLTSAGYSASFNENAAVTFNAKASVLSGTSSSSSTAAPVTLTGAFTTADPPIGTYTGSFVVSVMI
jgi:spore coat protein U-like protein